MVLSPSQLLKQPLVGNDAGWALTFHGEDDKGQLKNDSLLTISRDDYYAEIQATLPSDLAGGTYTFTVEGMTDGDYMKIAPFDPKKPNGKPTVVRLYLYWRDTNASPTGYLANLAGLTDLVDGLSPDVLKTSLVAELAIISVARQVGERRYEAVITAQERVFKRLTDKKLATDRSSDKTLKARAEFLCEDVGLKDKLHTGPGYGFSDGDGSLPPLQADAPGNELVPAKIGATYADSMKDVANNVAPALQLWHGPGMLLIRDGELHLGKRPVPLKGSDPTDLSFTNGLLASKKKTPVQPTQPDPVQKGSPAPDAGAESAGSRDQWDLTLKGRPDIKPGDVVQFHPPKEEIKAPPAGGLATFVAGLEAVAASFVGPLLMDESTENWQRLYVVSVVHKLGRTSGFSTTVSGFAIDSLKPAKQLWETTAPVDASSDKNAGKSQGSSASPAANAAASIRSLAESVAALFRHPEVAEVRAANATGTGSAEPPAQTLRVWRGLTSPDGRANQARRLPIRRHEPEVAEGVAYASPFAWGKCGLVLPRYPGTRVLVVHRNGVGADPVDIGALWESGHGPESQAGDWWLILPAALDQSSRASIADDETPPTEYTGKVTNDLIDADGNRVMEVVSLTIHAVEKADDLKAAGERPSPADASAITLSFGTDTSIVLSKDEVHIKAKKITLEASDSVEVT